MVEPIRFGFLNEPLSVSWRYGTIRPVPKFEEIASCFEQSASIYKGWVYPPIKAVDGQGAAAKKAWVPTTFSLPSSHILRPYPDADPAYSDFFIALFGFLRGRRLQREGWQHFYKTPLSQQLCDFVSNKKSIEWALNQALAFCEMHSSNMEVLKLAFGALHWHTFAQLYEHEFERFDAQYKALDACYKLTCLTQPDFIKQKETVAHAKRAMRLCEHFGIEPPDWVIQPSNQTDQKTCELAIRRNALAHEALYGGQPLGFAHPADHGAMDLGLKSLVARILLCALGIKNEYTQSSATTKMDYTFDCPQSSN